MTLETLDAGQVSASDHRVPRLRSIRASLLLLVTACVLPAVLVSSILVYQDYHLQRDRIYQQAILVARNLAAALDRELVGVESGLRVLATSPDLAAGDLDSFQRRATDALKFQIVSNYVMLDRGGEQRLNTLRPYGEALPFGAVPTELQQIFDDGKPAITGLFTATLTHAPVVAVGVPVYRGSTVVYSLNGTLTSDAIATSFSRQKLPEGWVAAVLDQRGTIIARSRDPGIFVGQSGTAPVVKQIAAQSEGTLESVTDEGTRVFTAFSRSSVSSWSVAVGAPAVSLRLQLYRSVSWIALAAMLAFGVGIWWAIRLAERVSGSVQALIGPALALGTGEPIELRRSRLKEADALGKALMQASRMLQRAQHLAHHDSLTGLPNRMLFDELATHQVAIAKRTGTSVAILALDLDGFKAVNDVHGHATGDLVLRVAAERIRGSIRASDVAARIGGDEFAVLLSAASPEQARVVADSLVEVLAEAYPDVIPPLSASVGIALFPLSGAGAAELMERADAALYKAKRMGKRRVAQDSQIGPP